MSKKEVLIVIANIKRNPVVFIADLLIFGLCVYFGIDIGTSTASSFALTQYVWLCMVWLLAIYKERWNKEKKNA